MHSKFLLVSVKGWIILLGAIDITIKQVINGFEENYILFLPLRAVTLHYCLLFLILLHL